jgi:protein O-GlcNAc transferase
MPTATELFEHALRHFHEGDLNRAEALCRQIVALEAGHVEALHMSGILERRAGRPESAAHFLRQALALKGGDAACHSDLGIALDQLGQSEEALACFQEAVRLEPNNFRLCNNLGIALIKHGKTAEAERYFREILHVEPKNVGTLFNLGIALYEQGQLKSAADFYRQVIQLDPQHVGAFHNLGITLYKLGRIDEAITAFRRTLRINPHHAKAHGNLGWALKAASCCHEALRINPSDWQAWNNLGKIYQDLHRLDEARAAYQHCLLLHADCAMAHHNLANLHWDEGHLDEAVASERRALKIDPDFLLARGFLVHGLQHLCDWQDLEELTRPAIEAFASPDAVRADAEMPPFIFMSLTTPPTTAEQQLRCSRRWVEKSLTWAMLQGQQLRLARPRPRSDKITVGYLSADYRTHPVAQLIIQVLERHDRTTFNVFGYSYGPEDSTPMRERMEKAVDRFVELRNSSFLEAAQRIAADQVDILVDLTGYTQFARSEILALRPAAIQVNYLGFTSTMGAPFIDYILVDDFIVPPEQQPFFTEKLVHLPGCYQVGDNQRPIAAKTPTRVASGLPKDGFVFCCFNNNSKIGPVMFTVWMDLLKAIPKSVLWLRESNRFFSHNLRREAVARGVAPERLVFGPRAPVADHLARHRLADLFLDAFPFNAHATASDALWAGCPVLTLAGQTFVSRVTGSLLRTLGLPELITTSFEEYSAMALRLARDPDMLAELRTRLAANRLTSPVFDAGPIVRNLEQAYRTMLEVHASGAPPRPITVSPT